MGTNSTLNTLISEFIIKIKETPSSTWISLFSLVISGVSLGHSIITSNKSKCNLNITIDKHNSFYFTGIDPSNGNRESLIIHATIYNNSTAPIHISDLQLVLDNISTSASSSSEIPYPDFLRPETYATIRNNKGFLDIKSTTGDGYHIIELEKKMLRCPIYLQPYEGIEGYILFPQAGVSCGKLQTTKIKILTSRKNFVIKTSIRSKNFNRRQFDH